MEVIDYSHLIKSLVQSSPHLRVLVVEDDLTLKPLWFDVLERSYPSAKVVWAETEESAEFILRSSKAKGEMFDIVVSDIFLSSHRTGVDLLERYGHLCNRFILMSAIDRKKAEYMFGEEEIEPTQYLQKPLTADKIERSIRAAVQSLEY